jgi:DMSO reductase anchor subunit
MDEKFSGMIPLIIFTSLLPAAIGIETGITITCFFKSLSIDIILTGLLWSLVFTLLSGVVVLFHLGHAERGPYIIRGVIHSVLSREIILSLCFSILLVTSALYVYRVGPGTYLPILLALCAVFGIATAFTIGRVYNLPSQITWRGNISSFESIIAAIIISLAVTFVLTDKSRLQIAFLTILLMLIIVEALFVILKLKRFIVLEDSQCVLVFPEQRVLAIVCYVIKLILVVSAFILLIIGHHKEALFFITYGILLDRIAFYASTAIKTPKESMAIIKNERMKAALIEKV